MTFKQTVTFTIDEKEMADLIKIRDEIETFKDKYSDALDEAGLIDGEYVEVLDRLERAFEDVDEAIGSIRYFTLGLGI